MNIEEMEKRQGYLNKLIIKRDDNIGFLEHRQILKFMEASINLHKDCINRIAQLEKEWAEHLKFLQTDYPGNYRGTD
jgi:hypothetical protein